MRLERDKALFSGSRLYRQAGEIADELLLNMQVPVPLGEAVACLRDTGLDLAFRPGELDRPIEALRSAVERQIDFISPYHAIPALFSAVASFDTPRPAATSAFKVLAVRLYGRVWADAPGVSASRLALVRAARLVYAERLLGAVRMAWAVQPSGHAEITPEGMSFDAETDDLLQANAHALAGGGLMQRFSGDPTARMHKDPEGFLLGACGVLAGDRPATKRVFAGTFLRTLPGAGVARGYWAALAARLLLLETVRRFASQVHDDPRGIAILGLSGAGLYGPAAEHLTKRDHALLQREVDACSWEPGWLKDVLSSGEEPHAFVERPACRITSTKRLFVTSERNITDSITALTERAVGPYSGKRRWALPDWTFELLVSRPFEAITVKLFREHGFVAGEVTAKGAWLTQDGPIQPPSGVPRPKGQIDVLAWHPTGYLLVGDCKILQLPHSETAWANLWKKLHEDEQGFRGKIIANTEWALKFLSATGRAAPRVAMALILDQPLHLWRQSGQVAVTDYPNLARKLADGRIPAR
jgi:hypothetical protein